MSADFQRDGQSVNSTMLKANVVEKVSVEMNSKQLKNTVSNYDNSDKGLNTDHDSNSARPNSNINKVKDIQIDDGRNSIGVFSAKGISLMSFNIATLPGKFDEFRHFVQTTHTDIIALNETRLDSMHHS